MNKVKVILILLLTCVSANAQKWVGGNVMFGGTDYQTDEKSKLEKTFRVYPTFGFVINDQWECGLAFGLGHLRNIDGLFYGGKETDLLIKPFVRYSLWDNAGLSLFIQGNVMYDYNSRPFDVENENGNGYRTYENKRNTFGISFQPGLKYCLDSHIILTATFGDLYAQTTRLSSNQGTDLNGRRAFVPTYERKSGKGGLEIGKLAFSIAYQF